MGETFWGVDFESEIAKAMTPSDLPSFTLSVPAAGAVSGIDGVAGSPTTYACHGAITKWTDEEVADAPLVRKNTAKIVIIAKPLNDAGVRPDKGQTLTTASGKKYVIMDATGDGAGASFMLACR